MAIRVIEGVPGSGKTYYAVHHLITNYFHWSQKADCYIPNVNKDDDRPLKVITNIDLFRVGESLDIWVQKHGTLGKFLSLAVQKELAKTYRVVYVIDEAQRLFHSGFKERDVFFFFQYHRHLGFDVYLITQDVKVLSLELRNLAEYYVRAVRRTYSLTGEFRYRYFGSPFDSEPYQTKILRPNLRIFSVYRSMSSTEVEKIKSAPRRMVVIFVVGLVFVVGLYYGLIGTLFGKRGPSAHASSSGSQEVFGPPPPPLVSGASSSDLPSSPPQPQPFHVLLRGIASYEDRQGSVIAESDGMLHRYKVSDFLLLCRCWPSTLRTGSMVTLYPLNGLSATAAAVSRPLTGPAREQADAPAAPRAMPTANHASPVGILQ